MKTQLSILASLVTVGLSTQVNAVESDGIQSMLKNGQVQGMLRYSCRLSTSDAAGD